MEWDNEDALILIQQYEKHELLWNPKHQQHFNKIKKADAWDDIAKTCSVDVDEVKKKMSSLLGSFRREKAKGKKTIRTGTGMDYDIQITKQQLKNIFFGYRYQRGLQNKVVCFQKSFILNGQRRA